MARILNILAITEDSVQVELLSRALDWTDAKVESCPLRQAPAQIKASTPDVAIVFVNQLSSDAESAIQQAVNAADKTKIIVGVAGLTKSHIVSLVKLGVSEVLDLPLDAVELRATIEMIQTQSESLGGRAGQVWSVFGAAGGCGVTSVAVNAAERLAAAGKRAAVVDLNLEMGDVSIFLNTKAKYTLADLAINTAKVDASYISSTAVRHSSGLDVISAPHAIEEADQVTAARLKVVFRHLRDLYDFTIIDTPSVFNETTIEALDHSDGVLLVSMLNIPNVRNAKRIKEAFDRLGYPKDKVHLIFNRFQKNSDIGAEEAAKLVGLPIFHEVANDYPSVIHAINIGEPVAKVAARSRVTQAFEELAQKMQQPRVTGDAEKSIRDRIPMFVGRRSDK